MQTVLTHVPFPPLPAPPSWYPGHMTRFTRQLPALLTRTDVVLELRDSRLPLTSINSNLEAAIKKWQASRGRFLGPSVDPTQRLIGNGTEGQVCERIVVFNKRDLVPEWGYEPFRRAWGTRFPGQHVFFASWTKPKDVKTLSDLLITLAKRNPFATEMNVLVIGMPNVGKSSLINALRNAGISGRTPKAMRTSANPGHTQTISTRLKLSEDPLVYSYDSPGVMLPFLGNGPLGAERGAKLALISGLKEGLYDPLTLAEYLLYRLNNLSPKYPSYMQLLPPNTPPIADLHQFLTLISQRHGMIKRGNEQDLQRAATRFINWWREEGGLRSASVPGRLLISGPSIEPQRRGWGFDFEWTVDGTEQGDEVTVIQRKMEESIDHYEEALAEEERDGGGISTTQQKKWIKAEKIEKRKARTRIRATRKGYKL
ncbi:hypothetical protein HWV62_21742 [Athelia sp. TMB]|nr:hypothetical protein HWV62_21742 [Athelia sp. TMB]